MRWSSLLRESWRNVATGTSGVGLYAMLLLLITGGLSAVDVVAVHQLSAAAQRYQASGASIVIVQAQGRIDPAACDAIAMLPGVHGAGAIRTSDANLRSAALLKAPFATFDVSQRFHTVLRAAPSGRGGLLIPVGVSETLGLSPGGVIALADGRQASVDSVYAWDESDGRRPGLGHAALVPVTDKRPFDECWADAWPPLPRFEALVAQSVLPASGQQSSPITATRLNTTLGDSFTGTAMFAERPTRYVSLLTGFLGTALGVASIQRRRLELASQLHIGVPRPDLMTQLALETLAWVTLAVHLTLPGVALALARSLPEDRPAMLLVATSPILTGATAALLGTLGATLSIREHALFRYFKIRS